MQRTKKIQKQPLANRFSLKYMCSIAPVAGLLMYGFLKKFFKAPFRNPARRVEDLKQM